ncbi:MAG: glycosyltransferase [Thermoplasmata archaeon]
MVVSLRSSVFPPIVLTGGIVAHNEERNIAEAVRSLQDQCLPVGTQWGNMWVVASGCRDRTVEIAQRIAAADSRVHVVIEDQREGKAHALTEVLRRAEGDFLVLLNADAVAAPYAVSEMLRTSRGHARPLAVMGRPAVTTEMHGRLAEALRLQWALHDELHREILESGEGTHLSDELLLLSLPGVPSIPDGIINDGSYIGAWLTQQGGARLYAPGAVATIQTASRVADHLRQRRRIRVGHVQSHRETGIAPVPTSFPRYFLDRPTAAMCLLRRAMKQSHATWSQFAALAVGELTALGLAAWDRVPPRRDYVRWQRIRTSPELRREKDPSLGSPGGRSAAFYR